MDNLIKDPPFIKKPIRVDSQVWDDEILPLVSVSCITFNHVDFIRQTFDGFLMQETTFRIEILIHDDASTDGTSEVVLDYQEKFPNLFKPIIQKENQYSMGIRGISKKFNYPRAKGKYIALCEGDDYWTDPKKLQMQVDFLENNSNYIACFHNAEIWYEDGYKRPYSNFKGDQRIDPGKVLYYGAAIFPTASLMFKKVNFQMPDYLKELSSGDRALTLMLLMKGDFYYFDKMASVYRIHKNGVFSGVINDNKKRIELHEANIESLKKFKSDCPDDLKTFVPRAISKQARELLIKSPTLFDTNYRKYFFDLNFVDFLRLIKYRYIIK